LNDASLDDFVCFVPPLVRHSVVRIPQQDFHKDDFVGLVKLVPAYLRQENVHFKRPRAVQKARWMGSCFLQWKDVCL